MADASNFQSWTKEKLLGKSNFEVWLVTTDMGEKLAAKYIDMKKAGITAKLVENEIAMLRKLSHQNVVKFVAVKYEGNFTVVFTEVVNGSDLETILERGKLSEDVAKGYLRQICSGLYYLHTRNPPVLHRDIKGGNIMVTSDGTVKLIDFGISIDLVVKSGVNFSQVLMTMPRWCGTRPFVAPELFNNPCRFSMKSDVWALGITIYQMMVGQRAFEVHCKNPNLINFIVTSGAPQLPAGCSQQLADFYACCTAMDPAARKSVRQLLEHEFIR